MCSVIVGEEGGAEGVGCSAHLLQVGHCAEEHRRRHTQRLAAAQGSPQGAGCRRLDVAYDLGQFQHLAAPRGTRGQNSLRRMRLLRRQSTAGHMG